MKKITPFLWFNNQAEEAMNFYVSVFKNSKVLSVSPLTVHFELNGQEFVGLNGGPGFPFTEAVSFVVNCETQQEVDDYWTKLTADGGKPGRCGWLKDKFGVSWQVVPTILGELLRDNDSQKSGRVVNAVMQMDKLDIARLQQAAQG
jgi:predicted 3-demethylubiquinone-9 3-methyltransferase (glyoxalase superfamily)